MTGPSGNSGFCFPLTLNVPRGKAEGNIGGLTVSLGASHSVLKAMNKKLINLNLWFTQITIFLKKPDEDTRDNLSEIQK